MFITFALPDVGAQSTASLPIAGVPRWYRIENQPGTDSPLRLAPRVYHECWGRSLTLGIAAGASVGLMVKLMGTAMSALALKDEKALTNRVAVLGGVTTAVAVTAYLVRQPCEGATGSTVPPPVRAGIGTIRRQSPSAVPASFRAQ